MGGYLAKNFCALAQFSGVNSKGRLSLFHSVSRCCTKRGLELDLARHVNGLVNYLKFRRIIYRVFNIDVSISLPLFGRFKIV